MIPKVSTAMAEISTLDPVVAEHIRAVNACGEEAIVATFADDALVNDARREFWGTGAICRRITAEMTGAKVTVVTEVLDHHGDTIVRGRYDGEFDRTGRPDDVIRTSYFTVRDGRSSACSSSGTRPSAGPDA